jgi:hypothetical protein
MDQETPPLKNKGEWLDNGRFRFLHFCLGSEIRKWKLYTDENIFFSLEYKQDFTLYCVRITALFWMITAIGAD